MDGELACVRGLQATAKATSDAFAKAIGPNSVAASQATATAIASQVKSAIAVSISNSKVSGRICYRIPLSTLLCKMSIGSTGMQRAHLLLKVACMMQTRLLCHA